MTAEYEPYESEKVQKAFEMALKAHEGQTRANGTTPYIVHPRRVVEKLLQHDITDENVLCAALLHDAIEDTPLGYGDIKKDIGEEVADLVRTLSQDTRKTGDEREPEVLAACAQMTRAEALIKGADIIDNMSDMAALTSGFQRKLVERKIRILTVFECNESVDFDTPLFAELNTLITNLQEQLLTPVATT